MSSTVALHLRDRMVKMIFQADIALPLPSTLYLALTYDVPPSNSVGLMLSEPIIGGYARQPIGLGSDNWVASGFGEVLNSQLILFPVATLDWGLLKGWALMDTLAGGTGKAWSVGSLLTPTYVSVNNEMAVAPRTVSVGLFD